ncbi:RNase H domain-containing protein [Trichonephila clavipes]|nr:RNase H domain-containing protein [Trichonephila clavipes]
MKLSEGCKNFEMCTNCSSEPASPAHILQCLGLTKQDLADDPLLVLDYLKVYDVMDLMMIPAYNKRCAAFPIETGIHYRRKTDFFPEDTTMSYSGFKPTRLQVECHSHHIGCGRHFKLSESLN